MLGCDIALEVTAESAVVALAEACLFRVTRMIQVTSGVTLVVEHKAHGVPWQINGALLCLRIPVSRFAEFALAVGPEIIRLRRDLFVGNVIGSSELEASVLRIAIDTNLAAGRLQARGKLDERTIFNVVNGQFALFQGERLVFLAVPAEQDAVPA